MLWYGTEWRKKGTGRNWHAPRDFDAAFTRASVDICFMHTKTELPRMRTTINLDDDLLEKAHFYTGIKERTALIHEALRVLIAREAGRRLAKLGGSDPNASVAPRRRAEPG